MIISMQMDCLHFVNLYRNKLPMALSCVIIVDELVKQTDINTIHHAKQKTLQRQIARWFH